MQIQWLIVLVAAQISIQPQIKFWQYFISFLFQHDISI